MSANAASSPQPSPKRVIVRRVLLGHRIRHGEPGLRGVGRASNVITGIASVLVIGGAVSAPILLTIAELGSRGATSTAGDLLAWSLLTIAAGFTIRFIGAVANSYAQTMDRPRSRFATASITVGYLAFALVGGFLLFWFLAALAIVGLFGFLEVILILAIAAAAGIGLAVLVGRLLPSKS